MRKIAISALLFPVLLAMTMPVGSQTRPRRVSEAANNSSTETASNSTTLVRADERPRVIRERVPAVVEQPRREVAEQPRRDEAGRGNGLLRGLLGMGIAIGASRGGRSSCAPSRGALLGLPRFGY